MSVSLQLRLARIAGLVGAAAYVLAAHHWTSTDTTGLGGIWNWIIDPRESNAIIAAYHVIGGLIGAKIVASFRSGMKSGQSVGTAVASALGVDRPSVNVPTPAPAPAVQSPRDDTPQQSEYEMWGAQ
jgi:hypothetical protein